MKTFLRSIAFLLFALLFSFISSDCKTYFPVTEGTVLTYSNYKGKGKLDGTQKTKVLKRIETDDNLSITLHATTYDKKNEEIFNKEFDMSCIDGVFKIDLESVLTPEIMTMNTENMEVNIQGENIGIPLDKPTNENLDDGKITVSMGTNGTTLATLNIDIINRRTNGFKTITTPAGTFECLEYRYDTKTQMSIIKTERSSIEWYAENIGLVKTETYKKGKLEYYSELVSLSK